MIKKKNMKSNDDNQDKWNNPHIAILIISFIFSQKALWDLISMIIPETLYSFSFPAFQLFFAYMCIVESIYLTGNRVLVSGFLKSHPGVFRMLKKIFHSGELILAILPRLADIISLALSFKDESKRIKRIKREIIEEAEKHKEDPLIVRSISFAAAVTALTIILCYIIRDNSIDIILEVMNTVISFIGLFLVLLENGQRNDAFGR